jgi:hypothetical protein
MDAVMLHCSIGVASDFYLTDARSATVAANAHNNRQP